MEHKREEEILKIKNEWLNLRWKGIKRDYTAEDVHRLRGSVHIENTISQQMSEKLWQLLGGSYLRTGGEPESGAPAVLPLPKTIIFLSPKKSSVFEKPSSKANAVNISHTARAVAPK